MARASRPDEKWRLAAATEAPRRYVVANGYGADPASGTDRALLTLDPFSIVEGVAIACLAVGATEAFIAVRSEDAAAIAALDGAIAAASDAGFIGLDVPGVGHDILVSVRPVQGAYMLGEETVLLKALEGKRGQPEQRPPHPAERGLLRDADRRPQRPDPRRAGLDPAQRRRRPSRRPAPPTSPGTVLVQVRTPGGEGIAEVPLGTPLRDIVQLGGALPAGRSVKALLVGGPSGGLLPPDLLERPYASMRFARPVPTSAPGPSSSPTTAHASSDLARLLTRFCAGEACGKTIPCRIGTKRLVEIADRVVDGRPKPTDGALLADLWADIVASALCDHERLTTLPLTSGMRYFGPELDDHILRSTCPAGVCHPIAVTVGASA